MTKPPVRSMACIPVLEESADVGVRQFQISRLAARISALYLLTIAALSGAAFAAKHPVQLEKNVDSATCISCHEDKAKGKFVHSAIAMGCTSCHEVRVEKDVTRIKLTTTTTSALCLSCHDDKKVEAAKGGKVHPPAVRDCVKCHDPHVSDNKNQLLKPVSGGEKENLCLSCHKIGLNVPEKGSRHAALDMGCDSCHVTHRTGPAGKLEFDFHLAKATPALCLDCHDAKSADLQKAHQNQPFDKADCVTCHDPHESAAPKLMAKFRHPPFADKQCDLCHAPAQDGKVVLTDKSVKSLCVTCHDDKAKLIDTAKVQHPGAAGDCTDCHNPHASRQPGLPKTNSIAICLDCHSDIADLLQKKPVHHEPASELGCGTCHEPHGGDNEKLLRSHGDVNALCLECHSTESRQKPLEAEHMLTIFDGKVKVDEDYFVKTKTPRLRLRYGLGHPVANHPVANVMDPANVNKVKILLSCLSCHQPHASAQAGLLIKDEPNNLAFCDNCHKNRFNMMETTTPGE